jgi:SAM-dependent methyltransferase
MKKRQDVRALLVQRYRQVRNLGYWSLKPFDTLFRKINRLDRHPPIHLRRQVGCLGDLSGAGPEFVSYLKLLAGLKAGHHLWDVGCGCGFLELALEQAGWKGELVGTDIHKPSIEWAQRTITRRVPSFRFVHSDIYSPAYWPQGTLSLDAWLPGFAERDFDIVVAKSLCTHLLPDELDIYLKDISTRLTATGKALITFFILNPAQEELKSSNQISFTKPEPGASYAVRHLAAPTAAVAYEESYLIERLKQNGLTVQDSIYFGYWTGREDALSFQDMIVVARSD